MGRYELDSLQQKYDELHDLLCDYDQEECYIELIHKTVQEIIDKLPQGSRIGFRPCGAPTEWLIKNFDFSHVKITGIFDKNANCSDKCGIPVYDTDCGEMRNVDIFIATSFNWHDEIVAELEENHYRVLDIYRELEKYGVYLHTSPETYIKGTHTILHDYLMRWKKADESEKEAALRNLLTAACEAKDFYMLNDLCEKYKETYSFCLVCQQKYNELYELMKNLVAKREQKDVLWYWLDAVPYKWLENFSGLNALSKEGLRFGQTYTCTPFTYQSFKTFFSGILPLNDCEKALERVDVQNSDLLGYLKTRDYTICRIGGNTAKWADECIEEEFLEDLPLGVSCNVILWRTLCRLIASDGPAFLLAHFLVETHPPMVCAESECLEDVYLSNDRRGRMMTAANYVDKRLLYYFQFLKGGQRLQIFMSDHGDHISRQFPDRFWAQNKLHACCFVIGENIQKRQEEKIFSYLKFKEFVKWLVEPEKYDDKDFLSDYAIFQDTDIYSEEVGNRFIKGGKAEQALAYRGALDGTYKYAVNRLGREFFYKIIEDRDVEVKEEEKPEVFMRLKEAAGKEFPNLSIYKKYQHVSRIYEAAKKEFKS